MISGTLYPACASSDQCSQKGTYCQVGDVGRCNHCGQRAPLPVQTDPTTGGKLNDAFAADYVGFNTTLVVDICADPTDRLGKANGLGERFVWSKATVQSWCEACVHAIDGQVDDLTVASQSQANANAKGPFDWVALILATVVVSLTIAGELKVRSTLA